MRTAHKKLIGGLLAGLLVATIGAALATGQTDDATDDTSNESTPTTPIDVPFRDHCGMMGFGMCGYDLTDEQQTELEELMTSLREQNATPDEMRTAIQEKLDEFGVLDTQLDNEIAQAEERLTILNREKELRDEGYSWDEITSILEEEFGLDNAIGFQMGMMGPHGGPGHEFHGEFQDFTPPEESDQ